MSNQIIVDLIKKSKVWDEFKNHDKIIIKVTKELISLTELSKFLKGNLQKKNQLEVSISLVSDSQMQKINQKFRQKNKPTDVLSFPFLDEKMIHNVGLAKTIKSSTIASHLPLGDIIISYQTLKKDANKERKTFQHHLTHLLLHSILHLIGYDHEELEMEKEMRKIEVNILEKLGIKNPYITNE